MKEVMIKVNELLKIQGNDGNWNYDPYMQGMYNGMEVVIATIENRQPIFKSAPEKFISDKPDLVMELQKENNQ
jgi:hypothetical protein